MPSVGQTSSPRLRPRPRGGRGVPGRAAHSRRRQGAAEPDVPLSFLSPISPSDKTHLRPQDGVNRKEERKGPWGRPVELPPNSQDILGAENKHLPSPAIIIAFSVLAASFSGSHFSGSPFSASFFPFEGSLWFHWVPSGISRIV